MQDATHISVLIDRSGSMENIRTDAEGAVNSFFDEQRKVEGICTVHLWDFDAPGGNKDWLHQHFAGPLVNLPKYCLKPRGSTALLDAVALTIRDTGNFLSLLPEDARPDKVIFIIQTDGQENSSRENSWDTVAAMIKEQTEKWNWQFVFLGMGLDTFKQGDRLGIANVVASAGSGVSYAHTHSVMSNFTKGYREGHVHDMSAMAGVNVDSAGKVTNSDGEELDPDTGLVIKAES